jgi:hypothetical protein
MSSAAMQAFMAADLAALWGYEFTTTVTIDTKTYTVLVGDDSNVEQDAFGGPESQDTQQVHFKTADLPSLELGTVLTLAQGKQNKRRLVVSTVISADGNELIAAVRDA